MSEQAEEDRTPARVGDFDLMGIAINVEDLERAVDWWQRKLDAVQVGGTTLDTGEKLAFMRVANFQLELIEAPGRFQVEALNAEPPANRLPIGSKAIMLETDDVTALTDRLEADGVTIVWRDLTTGGVGPTTAIRDSEGNLMTILPRDAEGGD